MQPLETTEIIFTKTDFGAQSWGNLSDGTLSNGNGWQVARGLSNPGRVHIPQSVETTAVEILQPTCQLA